MSDFRAIYMTETDKKMSVEVAQVPVTELPEGDVLVDVHYSTLNYKDGLAITGKGKIVRSFPFVPGVDFSGVVAESSSDDYKAGDEVVLTGWGVGERHWGGLGEKARVKSGWLVKNPDGLSLKQSMAVATAGFTSMLCVMALEDQGVTPESGEILVTGAAGGVGSVAIAILAKLGYQVTAATGRVESEGDFLKSLGATDLMDRDALLEQSKSPLGKERFAGAIDAVGGDVLAGLLPIMKKDSAVAAVGVAGGHKLNTTVFPFILRGVKLVGVDSVYKSKEAREACWARIARDLPLDLLDGLTHEIGLDDVIQACDDLIDGKLKGRTIVNVRK